MRGLGGKLRGRKKRQKKRSISSLVNVLTISLIVVLYPIVVMPIYRSSSVTDGHRLLLVCFLHPLLHELAMMTQRLNAGKAFLATKTVLDKDRFHYALASLMAPLIIECCLITCKSLVCHSAS